MIKFPSIEQYRNVIRNVQQHVRFAGYDSDGEPMYDDSTLPTIRYTGTVKLHGTNAGIVWSEDDPSLSFQSRSNVLRDGADNAGFRAWGVQNYDVLKTMFENILMLNESTKTIAVFGEWCGEGIQKGVAISGVPKMFVIFAIKINDVWIDLAPLTQILTDENARIFSICAFPSWSVDIDFEHPERMQNALVELTEAVEKTCPVGLAFGQEGIGEGIVWKPAHKQRFDENRWNDSKFWFKVKGDKHQSSKVKTLAPVDIQAVEAVNDFVDMAVSENRLEQGLDILRETGKPFEMQSLGDFIRWIVNDVHKEEADTIAANNLDQKKINPAISNKARKWYMMRLNS